MLVCLFCNNTSRVGAKVMTSFLLLSGIHHNQTRFLYFFHLIFRKKKKSNSKVTLSLQKSTINLSLSLSLIIRLCLIDSAHPPSQPTATVLEMLKGKFFYKVQSKTQVSKGCCVPREGISRHKDAATLLQHTSSVSFFSPLLRLHRESPHHHCSLRMNFFFFSPLVHMSLTVEAAVVVKARNLFFFEIWPLPTDVVMHIYLASVRQNDSYRK